MLHNSINPIHILPDIYRGLVKYAVACDRVVRENLNHFCSHPLVRNVSNRALRIDTQCISNHSNRQRL